MSTSPSATPPSEAMRQAWHKAAVRPLWENPLAHNARTGGPPAHLWAWSELEPLVKAAMAMTSMSVIERRVLTLVDPAADGHAAGTTTNLTAALQILMPGESARPHRHSMNALRFVLDGAGAVTRVDGRDCPMAEGDLVITPGWSWHEHAHHGSAPIVWLDALDAPLHRHLGTDAFEPGPAHDLPSHADEDAFATPSIVPELAEPQPSHSPVFRYPWDQAARAVAAAPRWKDGARRVRYVNPLTGGPVMSLLDCYLLRFGKAPSQPRRVSGSAICFAAAGSGRSTIGDTEIELQKNDIFSIPHWTRASHRATRGDATLFMVTDDEVMRRLELWREES